MPAAPRPASGAAAGDRRLHGRRPRAAMNLTERAARHLAGRSDRPRRQEPRQELLFARRSVRPARVRGGEGRVVRAAQGQDARARRRIGIGQDDGRPDADAPARGVLPARRSSRAGTSCRCRRRSSCRTSGGSRSSSRIRTRRSTRASPSGSILTEPMNIHGIGANAQERTELAFELLGKVGPARSLVLQVSARVFGRAAAADRDRALPDDEARHPDLRRVGLGARRLGAGAGAEPAAGPAGRIRACPTSSSRTTSPWSSTSPTRSW